MTCADETQQGLSMVLTPMPSRRMDLDEIVPICLWQPLEKKRGEGKMSRDLVCGASTLLLAVGLIAALVFLRGAFSV